MANFVKVDKATYVNTEQVASIWIEEQVRLDEQHYEKAVTDSYNVIIKTTDGNTIAIRKLKTKEEADQIIFRVTNNY